MTKETPMITEFDAFTGEYTERELTDSEATELAIRKAKSQAALDQLKAAESAKKTALDKLAALGLTEIEIRAIFGN